MAEERASRYPILIDSPILGGVHEIHSAEQLQQLTAQLEGLQALNTIESLARSRAHTVLEHIRGVRDEKDHIAYSSIPRLLRWWDELEAVQPRIHLDTETAVFRYARTGFDTGPEDILTIRFDIRLGEASIVNMSSGTGGVKVLLLDQPPTETVLSRLSQMTGSHWTYQYFDLAPKPSEIHAEHPGQISNAFRRVGTLFLPAVNPPLESVETVMTRFPWVSAWGARESRRDSA